MAISTFWGIYKKTYKNIEFLLMFNGTKFEAQSFIFQKFPKERIVLKEITVKKRYNFERFGKIITKEIENWRGEMPEGDKTIIETGFSKGFERGTKAAWARMAMLLEEKLGAVYSPDEEGLIAALEDASEIDREDTFEEGRKFGYSEGYSMGKGEKCNGLI